MLAVIVSVSCQTRSNFALLLTSTSTLIWVVNTAHLCSVSYIENFFNKFYLKLRVNTTYELGAGAKAFATIDHNEFAVVGLTFSL
jgi:serine acetyltransferase